MRTCSREWAPAGSGCGLSRARRSSCSASARPRFCAAPGRSSTSSPSNGWPRPRNGFASPETGLSSVNATRPSYRRRNDTVGATPTPGQPQGIPHVTSTDEIYDKYLQKAIVEINDLAHEVAQAGGGTRVPVVGSGHPLADVMLLKFRPQPAEVQEGVAFYGRAGQAILKSLQRLHVDPMSVYGTNCVKFKDGDEDESRPFLTRELHIVQPKLIVAMGENVVDFLNAIAFPLADTVDYKPGELQRFTATVQVLVVPDIDASLDEAPAKTQFWNAFKPLGQWWAELPPY